MSAQWPRGLAWPTRRIRQARKDAEVCCNGDCQQGRACPRYQKETDMLPESRRVINARTFSQSYNPSDYDPITIDDSGDHWCWWCLAVILLGALLAMWWPL